MQINEFKRIIKTFADPNSEMLIDSNKIIISVNDNLIEADINLEYGDVFVLENGNRLPAAQWIMKRLAKLDILANRLKENIKNIDFFIPPTGKLSPTLSMSESNNKIIESPAPEAVVKAISERSSLETTVLYLTSDAGEGKTSLINHLAHEQAIKFLRGETSWLLVPVQLGGRHFLRFDDITIGALQNKYRFPFLYYNSFLELIKMGVIIPAFDGFEEMFVENSTGEAVSAMGMLVSTLESSGTILVAARKAYYEFENLKNQQVLFDSIRTYSVGFGKVELLRWNKEQFLNYSKLRSVPRAEHLYECISARLNPDHPLLTRAVLVRRLIDIALENDSLDKLVEEIHGAGNDYFSVFVKSIIHREAIEKWIDRSGERDIGTPLLSVEEHGLLLSHVALSMWESKVGYLKKDHLEFVADFYCETQKKSPSHSSQIRERLRGHALLVPSKEFLNAIEFDHDEFRYFFLGEGLAELFLQNNEKSTQEISLHFRRGSLPTQAMQALIRRLTLNVNQLELIQKLIHISKSDVHASYTHENCSTLIIHFLSGLEPEGRFEIKDFVFSPNALRDKNFTNLNFIGCFFAESSLENTTLTECNFIECKLIKIGLYQTTKINQVLMKDCSVESVERVHENLEYWDPDKIHAVLINNGFGLVEDDTELLHIDANEDIDDELINLEKIARYFMRSTHIGESVIKIKLGIKASEFIDDTVPKLLKARVIIEVENKGGTDQRRFRLGISWQKMNDCISQSSGKFDQFLKKVGANIQE